ncbi:MAG TPA: 6,7-dimethyl-8-ribityllumazine synthase [Thermoanaerobaculia bacterium]|nr:6,7-dimethyl-8-ribityllumazine synthase [Thermoanaerobaculia bacterium]
MSEIQEIQGSLNAAGRRFAIVASRFNSRVVEQLVSGAVDCLRRHGADDIVIVRVPGAWEIPQAAEELADPVEGRPKLDAIVALGVVIRGETPHFDYICSSCSRGLSSLSKRHHIPVGFGVLTCDTSQQAEERAGGKAGNKGWEAALAALEMADLFAQLHSS